MYLFLQLQSEGHGGGWLDVQMKHSGGSSVGKVASCCARPLPAARGSTSSCAGTTRTVISAAGVVLVSPDGPSGMPQLWSAKFVERRNSRANSRRLRSLQNN